MNKLRVIQWTTGKVGTLSTRGILDDPRLELVGVYGNSDEKAGTDAGTLCGRPQTGVQATTDIDALIALLADRRAVERRLVSHQTSQRALGVRRRSLPCRDQG